jgi:hypothetical protein
MSIQRAAKRRIYWLTESVDEVARRRAGLLQRQGFEVRFFSDLSGFKSQVEKIRPAIIVLGVGDDEDVTRRTIRTIAAMPEISTAKMILVGPFFKEAVTTLASCNNFRDILPIEHSASESPNHLGPDPEGSADSWTQRFIYSTSGRPKAYRPPLGQITASLSTDVGVPARITWITPEKLCLESRARLAVGADIRLGGQLAAFYGVPFLSAIVESVRREKLRYHFSEAHVVSWTSPLGSSEKTTKLFRELGESTAPPRVRVYVAVQDPTVRGLVMAQLKLGPFEIAIALKKQAIADEPRFFTPDLIILEDKLTTPDNYPLLTSMIESLPPQTSLIILGKEANIEDLKLLFPQRRIAQLQDLSPLDLELGLAKELTKVIGNTSTGKDEPPSASYLPPTNILSEAEIQLSGRLLKLHPAALQVALPYPVSRYALMRVMNPLTTEAFGRSPFVKVTACSSAGNEDGDGNFQHKLDCYLTDVNSDELRSFARTIWQMVTTSLVKFLPEKEAAAIIAWTKDANPFPLFAWTAKTETRPEIAEPQSLAKESMPVEERSKTDAVRGLSTQPAENVVRKEKGSPAKGSSALDLTDLFRALVLFLGVSLALWGLYTWLSPRMEHSGGVYTDQLKKFAPRLNPSPISPSPP